MPLAFRAVLRADLERAAGLLHLVVDGEALAQVARHRLLAVDVLAGVHRVDRDLGVPDVVRADEDGVDVTPVEDAAVVVGGIGRGQLQLGAGALGAVAVDVAHGRTDGIQGIAFVLDGLQVGVEALPADADKAGHDAVVGAEDAARRRGGRRRALDDLTGLGRAAGDDGGRRDGTALEEVAPRGGAGTVGVAFLFHRSGR